MPQLRGEDGREAGAEKGEEGRGVTPLIMKMRGIYPDVTIETKWFDVSGVEEDNEKYDYSRTLHALQNPLPFNACSIVGVDKSDRPFIILVKNVVSPSTGEKGLSVVSQILSPSRGFDMCPPFFCSPEAALLENSEHGMTLHFLNKEEAEDPRNVELGIDVLIVIAFWLEYLNKHSMQAYQASPKPNTAKRIRQGKKPMFDWHTVVIEPRHSSGESLGGTHATPRLHDVRGHWVVRNNKRFWRKPHKRGDASKGVIFKDYQIKGQEQRA